MGSIPKELFVGDFDEYDDLIDGLGDECLIGTIVIWWCEGYWLGKICLKNMLKNDKVKSWG